MNLTFWKKKPGTGNGAEDAPGSSSTDEKALEPLNSTATTRDTNKSDPASHEPETPVKTGLAARVKSKLAALFSRFKRAPAPGSEEGQDKGAHRRSKDDSGGTEETPAKPGLVARIKSKLVALTLRLKKAPEPEAEKDAGKETRRRSRDGSGDAEETPQQPGLVRLVWLLLTAFVSHYKKRLIFVLLLFLLIGIVYAAWDIIFPPLVRLSDQPEQPQTKIEALKKKGELLMRKSEEVQARADIMKKEGEEAQSQAETLIKKEAEEKARAEALKKKEEEERAQAEALKKKEEEERAQAEALKKKEEEERAQAEALKKKEEEEKARAEALIKKKAEEKARAEAIKKSSRQQPLGNGEVAVGSKDSKTAVKSLKEAIETMNTGSGNSSKNTAQ